jgi:phosphoribosylanthranilate isomerase
MKRALELKICGMREPTNLESILDLAPDYIGLIFYPPSPRFAGGIDPETLPHRKGTQRVGVFVNENQSNILDFAAKFHFSIIQLHGNESVELCQSLRDLGFKVWKAFGVDTSFDWNRLIPYQPVVDAFLFDTKSSQHGGTGQKFDWTLLQHYSLQTPFYLSGGLRPENILEAAQLEDERCVGLDLNSGFESSPAIKSVDLINETFERLRHE